MSREPDWTLEEFSMLLASAEIDREILSRTDLTTRSVGAIGVVRQGIALYGRGLDTHGILSKTMLEFLERCTELLEWAANRP